MQIAERSAGNVKVLDLSGQITFTLGDQLTVFDTFESEQDALKKFN